MSEKKNENEEKSLVATPKPTQRTIVVLPGLADAAFCLFLAIVAITVGWAPNCGWP